SSDAHGLPRRGYLTAVRSAPPRSGRYKIVEVYQCTSPPQDGATEFLVLKPIRFGIPGDLPSIVDGPSLSVIPSPHIVVNATEVDYFGAVVEEGSIATAGFYVAPHNLTSVVNAITKRPVANKDVNDRSTVVQERA